MLLPEVAELGTYLVEDAILVAGAVLELLPPTDQNHKHRAARNKRENDEIEEKGSSASPGKRATPGRRGSAAPRSMPG
jgi:hypothetical protein